MSKRMKVAGEGQGGASVSTNNYGMLKVSLVIERPGRGEKSEKFMNPPRKIVVWTIGCHDEEAEKLFEGFKRVNEHIAEQCTATWSFERSL